MRVRNIVIALCLLTLAAYTLPVVPCSLPQDVWPEADFAKVKTDVEAVVPHLRSLHRMAEKATAEEVPFYNLVAKHGRIRQWRTLLGNSIAGWYEEGTWAFGVSALPNMPHVTRDDRKEHFQVTPETLPHFLAWAKTAQIDAATGTYREEASPLTQ
ncbi:MAG: hypothetical protein ACO1TE_00665 [Prosthecobacter sp.]